jgi:hypothetical protein
VIRLTPAAQMVMKRGFVILLGLALALLSAAALILNLASPRTACRLYLCPEAVQLREARRQMMLGTSAGLAASVALYRQALARNPASPYRWCDLAEALLASGDTRQARDGFSQALRLGPDIPPILLHVAGFYFRQNETRPALRTMARILALVPDYDGLLFSYYDRMGVSLDEILADGVPAARRPAQSYFRHLLTSASPDDAEKAWQWVRSRGLEDDTLAGDYVGFLLGHRRCEAAADTWAQHLGPRRRDYRRGNLLFNGGFEFEPVRCPLDWRVSQIPEVEVSRDGKMAHSGQWSLRIDFRGKENLNYSHVSQTVCVRPGPLRFQAYVRTEGITTDQGVGFRVFDPESPARLDARTAQLSGDSDWRPLELAFVVPPETRLLVVQVRRPPSLKFDNKIAGTAWVDDAVLNLAAGR